MSRIDFKAILTMIGVLIVALDVLLNCVIRDLTRAESAIANSPEAFSPIAFSKLQKFLLDSY